ncbi:cupin domain-containing protein [Macrococcoides caseolyticum subsp. hominis]|uniref:cupin domain-containing protein n=1 Tax=Macrococcoides caseolyticum TaxID=69966 RepID=UPI000C148642|nr:cupin domain-containing protein [Macrococcus caseolyticus]RAI79223.1 cupin domain-containing protein [Macrococcus caseolyticus subsp. hominis]
MAYLIFQKSGQRIDNQEEIHQFLSDNEVIYEQWNTSKLPKELTENYQLTDVQKEEVLRTFDSEIKAISNRRGYKASDVISLSDTTPNLDELLQNFQREHHHTDDEVRFIVSGNGVFVIQGKDDEFFEVHLNPGDLISVPPNVRHYFTLSDNRKVVAVRIFVDESGWVPVYKKIAQ